MTLILHGKDPTLGIRRTAQENESFETWTSYSPTGSWTTNTTYSGWYRVIGDTLESRVRLELSGAPNSATLTFDLPTGTADLTKYPITTTKAPIGLSIFRNGSSIYLANAIYDNGIKVAPYGLNTTTVVSITSESAITETMPFTWGSGDSLDVWYQIPIQR